jgi:GNAT superfamily N-acetyltransferase
MLVRIANNDDISAIVQFQLSMAFETENFELDKSTVEKGVLAVLEDETKGKYYIAEKKGKIIGSLLTTYEWSDWRNGTVLWIQSVFILPEFRRKGVYSRMYRFIKNIVLDDESLNGIRLYADKDNKIAHKTYQKLGMSPDHYVTFEWLK